MIKSSRNSLGFTLFELIVVMMIIGTILMLMTKGLIGVAERARDVRRKNDLAQLRVALNSYKTDNGLYPNPGSPGGGAYPIVYTNTIDPTASFDFLVTNGYIDSLPRDPKQVNDLWSGKGYFYSTNYNMISGCSGTSYGTCYCIFAIMERTENANEVVDGSGNYISNPCGYNNDSQSKDYNYFIKNP